MSQILTDQDFANAKRDISDIDKAVNTESIVDPRWGGDFKSLPLVSKEWQAKTQDAQSTIDSWQDAINLITIDDGVPALSVSTANGNNQQSVNDFGGVDLWSARSYQKNNSVRLTNGDVVVSIIDGNTANPNTDMTGWVNPKLEQEKINKLIFPIFSVKSFGAKGDGVADDRAAIQAAIDACIAAGGGTVYFPSTKDRYYSVKSKHPTYTDSALVAVMTGSQYVRGGITFMGEQYCSRVQYDGVDTPTHLLNIPLRSNYMTYDRFYLEANRKCGYALYAADVFHPFTTFNLSTFRGGTIYAAKIATYVATVDSCIFSNSANGVFFGGTVTQPTAPSTSIVMNGCYANSNDNVGYEFGFTTYISMNACACDSNDIGYKFASAYGVSMNGCGAEKVRKPIFIQAFRGVSINTFYMLSCGSTNSAAPTDYLIEFVGGTNCTMSGIYNATTTGRYSNYILGLTGSSFGSENITVTDRSIRRNQCYFVTNFAFNRPIKLLRSDESSNNSTITVTNVAEFKDAIASVGQSFQLNHKISIKLADGDYNLDEEVSFYIENVSGSGELIIESTSGVNTAVKLNSLYRRLQVNNCTAKIRFKNLSISETRSNNFYVRLIIDASTNVILDNVIINRNDVDSAYGVRLSNGSRCTLVNGTNAPTAFSTKTWDWDVTSKFILPDASAAPTVGVWNDGMSLLNSAPTTHIGWVYSAGAWKTYGAIS